MSARLPERLFQAIHMQTPRACDLSLEAYWAWRRGDLDRSELLVGAAVRAHREDVWAERRGEVCLEDPETGRSLPCARDWIEGRGWIP